MNNLINTLKENEKKLLQIKTFHKNQTIFEEDQICESVGIITSGFINIVSYSFSGKEIIYNSLKKNDVFGNNLIFSDSPKFKGNVICVEETTVAFLNKASLLQLLQSNEDFLKEYLRIQSEFGKALNARIKLLSFSNAQDRLNYYFYINNNEINYKSVSSLAKILSLERETLSRLLSKLEKEKIIKRNKTKLYKNVNETIMQF